MGYVIRGSNSRGVSKEKIYVCNFGFGYYARGIFYRQSDCIYNGWG